MVHLPVATMGCLLLGSSSFAAKVALGIKGGNNAVLLVPDSQVAQLSSGACNWLGDECTSFDKNGISIIQKLPKTVVQKSTTKPATKPATKPTTKPTMKPKVIVKEAKAKPPKNKPKTIKELGCEATIVIPVGQPPRDAYAVADVLRKHGITVEKVITKESDMPKSKHWTA